MKKERLRRIPWRIAEFTEDKWRMQAGKSVQSSHLEPSTRESGELSADIANDLGL
jgi:hypothetical protein